MGRSVAGIPLAMIDSLVGEKMGSSENEGIALSRDLIVEFN